ncbi:MAG: flagellar biosynthetic protein FliO [Alphaproteobacteria bacterium]|nr:flagellar biosynthetic protein FliO [Alphaproteobacteria bacterium]
MQSPDPESISLIRVVIASLALIGLLGAFSLGMRYLSLKGWLSHVPSGVRRRLKLVETLPLDARRRLTIVQCDGVEHLLLLGINQDIVISSDLPVPPLPSVAEEKK